MIWTIKIFVQCFGGHVCLGNSAYRCKKRKNKNRNIQKFGFDTELSIPYSISEDRYLFLLDFLKMLQNNSGNAKFH